MTRRRFWRYPYSQWQPTFWWHYLWPSRGGDEWGRATLVIHVPVVGFVVWAYGKHQDDCDGCMHCDPVEEVDHG
jgi:hypothetical protein